jgi:predicted metal-binding protein
MSSTGSNASLLICNGCCCGHSEKGNPALPKARLQADWAAAGLEDAVRLRFVDCLGPCERANVVVVKAAGEAVWLAGVTTADYDALAAWAGASKESAEQSGESPPLPETLTARRIAPRGSI